MSARRWSVAAVGAGVLAAVVATYPLVTVMSHAVAAPAQCPEETCADFPLYVWALAWGGRQLYRDPLHVFEGNVFHPLRHTLAYNESMLSGALLVGPLNALTGNPILGYNLYYLATFALSVLGAFLLVRHITGDPGAALLAGWLFGLTGERFRFIFVQMLSVQWAPFLLFAWLRFLDAPGWMRGIALGAALVAHMHASAYHGLMLPVLLVPWALVLALLGPWPLERWLRSAAALGPALAVALAPYVPYVAVKAEMQYEPTHVIGAAFRYQYLAPLAAPWRYFAHQLPERPFRAFFSPLPVFLLLAAAALRRIRPSGPPGPPGQMAHLVAALVLLFAAAAVSLGDVPFSYLRQLPGFSSMRSLGRFMLLAAFAGSIVTGIAVAALLRRIPSRLARGGVLLALAALGVAATPSVRAPMSVIELPPPTEVPPVYRWLATTPPDTAILELPYSLWGWEARRMVLSLYHGRRLMNGYSAIIPRFPDAVVDPTGPVGLWGSGTSRGGRSWSGSASATIWSSRSRPRRRCRTPRGRSCHATAGASRGAARGRSGRPMATSGPTGWHGRARRPFSASTWGGSRR